MKLTPIWHLTVLSLATFGIYPYYWSYKQWKYIKKRDNLDISPGIRAWFFPIWIYSLSNNIQDRAREYNLPKTYNPVVIAVGVILLTPLYKLPDPFWLISLLPFVVLMPVVITNNLVLENEVPTLDKNPKIGIAKWFLISLGLIIFLLALLVTFYPDLLA